MGVRPAWNFLSGSTIALALFAGAVIGWMFSSPTLGAVASVVIYVLAAVSRHNVTTCPFCGAYVRKQASVCSQCGSAVR